MTLCALALPEPQRMWKGHGGFVLLVLPYKIRSNASGVSGLRRGQVLQCLCSTKSLREVMRFLTFAFSITKYSHTEELQHPDGMMNSLNQPQDVTVSTHKALGLCLD